MNTLLQKLAGYYAQNGVGFPIVAGADNSLTSPVVNINHVDRYAYGDSIVWVDRRTPHSDGFPEVVVLKRITNSLLGTVSHVPEELDVMEVVTVGMANLQVTPAYESTERFLESVLGVQVTTDLTVEQQLGLTPRYNYPVRVDPLNSTSMSPVKSDVLATIIGCDELVHAVDFMVTSYCTYIQTTMVDRSQICHFIPSTLTISL
jgi:hypothetical protein